MIAEDLQAIRQSVHSANTYVGEVDGKAYIMFDRDTADALLNEIERLQPHNLVGQVDELLKLGVEMRREIERLTNTENTYHSLELDRAREEIGRLRGALEFIARRANRADGLIIADMVSTARQALVGESK